MRITYSISLIIAALAVLGLGAGCTVGFDPSENPNDFLCEEDADCITPYVCLDNGVCGEEPPEGGAPPCEQDADPEGDIDLDNDGYGTGDNRRNCPQTEVDCDDSNPLVNPGQAELCDGLDNNCNDAADEFECQTSSDCPNPPSNLASYLDYFACQNGTCAMRPFDQTSELEGGGTCGDIFITCSSADQAFTYSLQNQTYTAEEGPVLECK